MSAEPTPEELAARAVRRQEIVTRLMGSGEVPMQDIPRVAEQLLQYELTGQLPPEPPEEA